MFSWHRATGLVLGLSLLAAGPVWGKVLTPVERGAYLLRAGGCIGCHTDLKGGGAELAGGRALKTPFGTFFSPNITPDPETGIGKWREEDFHRALRDGVAPDGSHYFPVFPYPAYTQMSDADIADLFAYLKSRAPVNRPNQPHDVGAPFGWRWLQAGWKALFFEPGPLAPAVDRDETWNRGAYLVRALTHCGECHTPRNALGAPDDARFLAGWADGPEGELAPNITPHKSTGIGDWDGSDLVFLMKSGMKPDYDNVQGVMEEAVEHGLKHLSDSDLKAIAAYVLGQKPVDHKVSSKRD